MVLVNNEPQPYLEVKVLLSKYLKLINVMYAILLLALKTMGKYRNVILRCQMVPGTDLFCNSLTEDTLPSLPL
jgi:uncharacterized membrane protein